MKASRSKKVIVKSVSPDTSFAEDGESTAIKEELKEFCENLDREAVVTDENVMPTKSQMQSPKRPLKTVPTVTPQKNEDGKLTKSFKKGAFGRLILVGSEEDKPKISATKVSPLVNIIYRYSSNSPQFTAILYSEHPFICDHSSKSNSEEHRCIGRKWSHRRHLWRAHPEQHAKNLKLYDSKLRTHSQIKVAKDNYPVIQRIQFTVYSNLFATPPPFLIRL